MARRAAILGKSRRKSTSNRGQGALFGRTAETADASVKKVLMVFAAFSLRFHPGDRAGGVLVAGSRRPPKPEEPKKNQIIAFRETGPAFPFETWFFRLVPDPVG